LGTISPKEGPTEWFAEVRVDSDVVFFVIAGTAEPCPARVSHARDIVQSISKFREQLNIFLEAEARRLAPWAQEIAQLKLESINLWWPARPNDGMIFFNGPDEFRVWRCDYIARMPVGLGFDD